MATTADYQWHLPDRNFTVGAGTPYIVGPTATGFLGAPDIDIVDLEHNISDGASGGPDRYHPRLITLPTTIAGPSPAGTKGLVDALKVGWRRLKRGETPLDIRLAGDPATGYRYFGRPRGVGDSDLDLAISLHRPLLAFTALDPIAYGPEHDTGVDTTTPVALAAADMGFEDTDRATITIAGNDGTPELTHDPSGGTIEFTAQLDTGDTLTVDLRARTVLLNGTPAPDGAVSTASTWFALTGGVDNEVAFTGAASVRVVWRAAFT